MCNYTFLQHKQLLRFGPTCNHSFLQSGIPPAGAVGALAAFQAVQGSSEAQLLRLLGDKASAILEAAKHLNWLPDQPPRTAMGHSAYIQDLLPFLKVQQCTQMHIRTCCPFSRYGNALKHTCFVVLRCMVSRAVVW